MHPSAALRGTKGGHLDGRRIVLAVSGSIAAVESVKIAHELQRHGATVVPVMTQAATKILNPLALEYATGTPPILHLTGQGEHVKLLGTNGDADLLLVAPATANTIAKIALGIDDTAVTSCATVAIGSGRPVVVAPAMHEVMGHNPAVADRVRDLHRLGLIVVDPRVEEGKAKIADADTIVSNVIHALADGPLKGRNVLVVSGSTAEPLDPVRVLTNRSSGRMGVELATAAFRRGARVDLWNAWGLVPLPPFPKVTRFERVEDLERLVAKTDLSRYHLILVPAALSDFSPPARKDKVPSDAGAFTVELKPVAKVLPKIRKKAPRAVLVGFKAETDAKRLVDRARERLGSTGADLFVANTSEAFGAEKADVFLVRASGKARRVGGAKSSLAEAILDEAQKDLTGTSK